MASEYWMQRTIDEQIAMARGQVELQTRTTQAVQDLQMTNLQFLKEHSGAMQLVREMEQRTQLTRALFGSLDESRRAALLAPAGLQAEIDWIRKLHADFEGRFRLPDYDDAIRLTERAVIGPVLQLANSVERNIDLQESIRNMTTPWLDTQDELRTVSGFAELQGIGHALATAPVFSTEFSAALRSDFGDWRDTISWPDEIFTSLAARSEFYLERGFNRALTGFPLAAFEQGLQIAGLGTECPQLVEQYGSPVPAPDDDEQERALNRTNDAHYWIMCLEQQVRRFIDEKMTQLCGPDWYKHRLPNGMYKKWCEKEEKDDQKNGQPLPLIAYADFTDYVLIICRRDNWKEVFSNIFEREESVRESFQRLYPIRVTTMHARLITQDDELFLFAETKRLMRAIS